MEIVSDKKEMIFKNQVKYKDSSGKEVVKDIYKMGLSRKNSDGTYSKTTILCKFKKDVKLESKTLIKLKQAWLDFYLKEKTKSNGEKYNETTLYIFINDFEICESEEETKDIPNNYKSDYKGGIELTDDDMPF